MGMWNIPLSLMNAGSETTLFCTVSEYVGDLYTWLGSPSVANAYNIIIDGCHLGDVIITLDFPVGTTFTFSCINEGSIDGLGGDGGPGGPVAGVAVPGFNMFGAEGGNALTSDTFDVNIDIDNGYLRAGGGGGGGGSSTNDPSAFPGGGGGGGAGFQTTIGGPAGAPDGNPPATAGVNGGDLGPGVGGTGGGGSADGGNGGNWGKGGQVGASSNPSMLAIAGNASFFLAGGSGGSGGNAFRASNGNLATLNYTGSKTEAQLRNEGRLLGETEHRVFVGIRLIGRQTFPNPTNGVGIKFNNDGSGTGPFTGAWQLQGVFGGIPHAAGNGDDFEVRASALPNTEFPGQAWDAQPGADGTWFALTSNREWTMDISASGVRIAGQYFEIRRVGMTGDEIIDGGWLVFENNAA